MSNPLQGRGQWAEMHRRAAGAWLKTLRTKAGLTQAELAKAVGLDHYTIISQIEAGKGRVAPERYVDWADACGVEPAIFCRTLLSYYDPFMHAALFPRKGKT